MPTKRAPLNRHRQPPIDDETLALFVELEALPAKSRKGDAFRARNRKLHERLGLGSEWFCSVVSVLDRRSAHRNPGSIQAADWERCHRVRKQLLEAAAERPA